jgi:hypothetical protein
MQETAFDILSGTPQTKVKWLESVTGLANARKRINELAAQTPGQYFIFNAWNSCIIEQIDTQQSIQRLNAPPRPDRAGGSAKA